MKIIKKILVISVVVLCISLSTHNIQAYGPIVPKYTNKESYNVSQILQYKDKSYIGNYIGNDVKVQMLTENENRELVNN